MKQPAKAIILHLRHPPTRPPRILFLVPPPLLASWHSCVRSGRAAPAGESNQYNPLWYYATLAWQFEKTDYDSEGRDDAPGCAFELALRLRPVPSRRYFHA